MNLSRSLTSRYLLLILTASLIGFPLAGCSNNDTTDPQNITSVPSISAPSSSTPIIEQNAGIYEALAANYISSASRGGRRSATVYKDHIADYSNGLNVVMELDAKTWDWNARAKRDLIFWYPGDDQANVGFIAEEVHTIAPEFVWWENGKIAGIHYDLMVGMLANAIQQQQAQINELKTMCNPGDSPVR